MRDVTSLCEAAAGFYEHICQTNAKFLENSTPAGELTVMFFSARIIASPYKPFMVVFRSVQQKVVLGTSEGRNEPLQNRYGLL